MGELKHRICCLAVMMLLGIMPLKALNVNDYRFHTMPETSYYGGIHSIAKDSVGRIWFSGADAVYMYDGLSYNRFNDRITSISPNSYWGFLQVVTAADRNVYVSTNNGLMRFDYSTKDFTCVLDGKMSFLTTDEEGTMWMIRNDAIEAWNPSEASQPMKYPFHEHMDVTPQTLTLSCSGNVVWVASLGVLYRLDVNAGVYEAMVDMGDRTTVIRDVETFRGSHYVLTAKDGIYRFSESGGLLKHYRLPDGYEKSSVAKSLYLDSQGILWAATQSGLFLVDTSTDSTCMLRSNIHYPYSLPNNSVWFIYPDADGGVWFGTYGGKLVYMPVSDSGGNWFKATPGGLSHSIVSCFEEDDKGNIWIGTEGGGINYWDRINNRYIYYTQENNSGVRSNMVKKLRYDESGRLVMSSFNGGIQVLDRESNRFVDIVPGFTAQSFLSVYDFIRDGREGYWLSDPDSPMRYLDLDSREVISMPVMHDGTRVPVKVETMYTDEDGSLCLVTSRGLYVVDERCSVLRHYYLHDVPFARNDLCCFCRTSGSEVWYGTRGGVNVLAGGEYSEFRDRNGNGLDGKTIFGILEDPATSDIWLSTNDGLYYYDSDADLFRRSTIDSHNLCGAYYVRSCFRTSSGEMLFGGTDGFIMFDPEKIGSNKHRPKPFFVDLKINSEIVSPEDDGSPLSRDISTMTSCHGRQDMIFLSHRQSNFEVSFSSDSYLDSDKAMYAYRMIGISDQWNMLPAGQRSVAFFDLPQGRYRLELKAANSDGLWGDEVISLSFRISPPPFLSIWAYALYAVILSISVLLMYTYVSHKRKFKEELEQKQTEISELYSRKYVAGPSDIVVTSVEDELLKKALGCIERNMDNNGYGVEDFVSDMAMGRTALYQKINEITGLSIKEFILDIRLKRAGQLLKESDKTISEISYMTGFVNPKYFSTSFKKHFGCTPSEYKHKKD